MTEKETSANPPSLPLELNTNKCNYFRQKYVQSWRQIHLKNKMQVKKVSFKLPFRTIMI